MISKTQTILDGKPPSKKLKMPGESPEFPRAPNVFQVVKVPKTHVNHTYRDFSLVPPAVPFEMPDSIEKMTFPQKLYHLLTETSSPQAKQSMEWCSHGRAWRILDNGQRLENFGLLGAYFGFNSVKKFRKCILNHGFRELTVGPDKGCFYSEFLLRGLPHLLQYAPREVDQRSKKPDPDNEPDLYRVSDLFPLPGQRDILQEAKVALAARGIIINDRLRLRQWPVAMAAVQDILTIPCTDLRNKPVHAPYQLQPYVAQQLVQQAAQLELAARLQPYVGQQPVQQGAQLELAARLSLASGSLWGHNFLLSDNNNLRNTMGNVPYYAPSQLPRSAQLHGQMPELDSSSHHYYDAEQHALMAAILRSTRTRRNANQP